MKDFTICVLFYGNYPALARRCLDSIKNGIRMDAVLDIRIGLNEPCKETAEYVFDTAKDLDTTVSIWTCPTNAYKYPLMRRMFYGHHEPAKYLMWFDDDSYLTTIDPLWIDRVRNAIEPVDMIGQNGWHMEMVNDQWYWIIKQPWYNPAAGYPMTMVRRTESDPYGRMQERPSFVFCQGAWWVAKRDMLFKHDWPWPELKHNGGDSMLGEMIRQQGYKTAYFDEGVRINADAFGHHSKSPRRGYSEKRLGYYGHNSNPDLRHQDFTFYLATFIKAQDAITASTSGCDSLSGGETDPDSNNKA